MSDEEDDRPADDPAVQGGDDGEEDVDAGASIVPDSEKGLRACLVCSLLQTYNQFYQHGCANCPFLRLEDDRERVLACSSTAFGGTIALLSPEDSWVAQWQRTANNVPGLYAVVVRGTLPEEVLEDMADRGIPYHPRDGRK